MWFGTDAGLCRYDGYRVQYFRIPQMGSDQYISTVKTYKEGLLVGTAKGAFYFDFRYEHFTPYLSRIIKTEVRAFALDHDGNVWISTMGQGVFRYQPYLSYVKQFVFQAQQRKITNVFIDADNQVWVMTNRGYPALSKLNKAKDVFVPCRFRTTLSDYGSLTMMQGHDGTLWLGTWKQGLLRITDNGCLEQVLRPSLAGVGYHIHTLYENGNNCILIGCDDGVVCFNPKTEQWRLIADSDNGVESLNDKFVYSIVRDHEGGLWFGTFYGGVNYLSPVGERFTRFGNGENGYRGNVVGRFCEDAYGHVWIASDDNGLACFSLADNRLIDYSGKAQLSTYNVHGLFADGSKLWIGTYTKGLLCYDIIHGSMCRYTEKDGLNGSSSYAIYRDTQHRLWVATFDAVYLYQTSAHRFVPVHKVKGIPVDIDEDRQGNIWIATQGDGIYRYMSVDKRWEHDVSVVDSPTMPPGQVNAIHIDANGCIWIASANGLYRYNSSSKTYKRLPLNLPSQEINGVLEDQGHLWLGTTMGIAEYYKGGRVQLFTRFDGLLNNQCQPNACLKASDGRLFFGSVKGFHTFYPYRLRLNHVEPTVRITGIKVMNKPLLVGSDKLPLSLNHLGELELSHSDNMVSFSFASLSYCSPEKNKYAYQLKGFDKEWNEVGSQHEATYTNIPAGTYTFMVRASNNDGLWSKRVAKLKVVVHPPFWLSLPAKLLYIVMVLFLVYEISQFRLRQAEHRHQQQMKQLNEKRETETREARLRFFTMIAHEIRTPVTLIIGPLEQIMRKLKDRATAGDHVIDSEDELKIIDRNAHRLLNLVNQLLDFNKVQQQGMQVHFGVYAVGEVMQEVADRFTPTLKQKGVSFVLHLPPADFTAMIDVEGITKILSNLMTNATKYTHDRITMACHIDEQHRQLMLEVANNGPSISVSEQKKIFQPFYQSLDNKPGTGIGLSIVQHIVQLHHGHVHVSSKEGGDTRFIVTLPLCQPYGVVGDTKNKLTYNLPVKEVQPQTPLPAPTEYGGKEKPAVLIVEDDEDMSHFLESHFKKDYRVLTAGNGVEALTILAAQQVSLIVSDWMMPVMDGAEFCRKVRADQNTSHIPLIMLTAKTDDESKAEGIQCGADAYIEKPFSMKYLEASIRHMIDMRRLFMQKFSHSPNIPITQMAAAPIDDDLLKRMVTLIEDNLNNSELSVNFLASQLHISRSSLFAKIKSLTDVTPNEMIQVVRLRKAAQLLREGNYRVSEICFMVGFNSPSYFSKCFAKQFGVKPGEY